MPIAAIQNFSKIYDPTIHEATTVVRVKLNHEVLFTERFFHADLGYDNVANIFIDAVWEMDGKRPDSDIDVTVLDYRHMDYEYYSEPPYKKTLEYLSKMGF